MVEWFLYGLREKGLAKWSNNGNLVSGLEPLTFWSATQCHNHLSHHFFWYRLTYQQYFYDVSFSFKSSNPCLSYSLTGFCTSAMTYKFSSLLRENTQTCTVTQAQSQNMNHAYESSSEFVQTSGSYFLKEALKPWLTECGSSIPCPSLEAKRTTHSLLPSGLHTVLLPPQMSTLHTQLCKKCNRCRLLPPYNSVFKHWKRHLAKM